MNPRKSAVVLTIVMSAASVLFGGGGSDSTPAASSGPAKQPVTLRLWGGVQPEYGYDAMAKNFDKEFAGKGIKMKYVRYVNDNNGNLQLDTYLASGGEVDIFMGYGGNARLIPRVKSGLILDMTDKLKDRGFDFIKELGANNVDGYLVDGHAYALPTKYENGAWIFANVNRFKEAGVALPLKGWTYDEFRDACKKLTRGSGIDKKYGMYWGVTYDRNNAKAIMSGVLIPKTTYKDDAKTETNFTDPTWQKGLQLMVDTMRTDKSAISLEEEIGDKIGFANAYLNGKAAMSVGIVQLRIIKDLAQYPHDFMTALIPAPVPSKEHMDKADHSYRSGAGDLISVSSKTKYPDACIDAVVWYIKGGMAPLALGGRIPLWVLSL
jgi:multiple sugar transport system substrate-binding protein